MLQSEDLLLALEMLAPRKRLLLWVKNQKVTTRDYHWHVCKVIHAQGPSAEHPGYYCVVTFTALPNILETCGIPFREGFVVKDY